jgi:hypothetical protein
MTRGVSEPVEKRLYSNVKINQQGCWEWQGAVNNAGYSFIRDGKGMRLGHRVSYEIEHNTTLPRDVMIGHTCYNYRCVNPNHLYPAHKQEIVDKMVSNNRYDKRPKRTGPHKRDVCKHCGTEMAINTLARYHNDNCKNKPIA